MITLDDQKANILDTSFNNLDLLARFKEKWKGKEYIKIKIGTNILIDLIKAETLNSLVGDLDIRSILVTFPLNQLPSLAYRRGDITISAKQLINQCSTIEVSIGAHKDEETYDLIEDIFSLMGYTIIILSLRDNWDLNEFITKRGFKPLINLQNRRTLNRVTIFFKQLQLWT